MAAPQSPPSPATLSTGPPGSSPAFLAQSRVGEIYAAVLTCTVLCTIAVALRFICRRMVKAHLWWDDWTILAALLVEWSLTAVLLYQTVDLNFGRHIQLMDRWQHIPFAKSLVATQLLYYCVQAIIKISLLLLYHRLFGVDKLFRTALYVSAALTLMWWLGSFLDTIFQCIPVAASWDNSIKDAKCQSIEDAALGTAIPNLILDILFLLLPVPIIWKLNVDKRVKVSLTGIFLLGAFVCTTSIIRIHQILATNWKLTDLTWDGFGINVWSTVESCCAIIGACLPTMRPLITRARAITINSKGSDNTRGNRVSNSAANNPRTPGWRPSPVMPRQGPHDRKAPYQNIDELGNGREYGNGAHEMKDNLELAGHDPHSVVP